MHMKVSFFTMQCGAGLPSLFRTGEMNVEYFLDRPCINALSLFPLNSTMQNFLWSLTLSVGSVYLSLDNSCDKTIRSGTGNMTHVHSPGQFEYMKLNFLAKSAALR